jgi:MFS transporter, DHA1 family, solute carrier family 18 (vesicular amine transporter), member 1/2
MNATCSFAIISQFFPEKKELYIGILEAGTGLGLLIGPLFGGVLYHIGGYPLPFLTLAILLILMYPVMVYALSEVETKEH